MAKNPPAKQETLVRSLGREDALKEGTATRSSILAWRIPQTEETGGLQSTGITELDTAEHTCMHVRVGSVGVWKILYLL